MRYVCKDVGQFIKEIKKRCKKEGISPPYVEPTKNNHLKVHIMDEFFFVPSTPSDWRWKKNSTSELNKILKRHK